jgi:serine/threonine protein kinase
VTALCRRFEQQWHQGERPRIEDFLTEALAEDRALLLEQLLHLEWDLHEGHGEAVHLGPYTSRFADQEEVVQAAWQRRSDRSTRLGLSATPSTTPLGGGEAAAVLAVLGRYENLELLGRGGMGVVYKAFDSRLKRFVAIKMIDRETIGPHWLARFRTEAEALARLAHPHIVQVHDWDEAGGQPYLVMEYVSGGNLEERPRAGQPGPVESARLVAVLARAVQHAHEAQVVHRDLKPGNVLLAPGLEGDPGTVAGSRPKVSDFGLARMALDNNTVTTVVETDSTASGPEHNARSSQTVTGMQLGTPAYMAPEQAAGKVREVGRPADVWALGVILYRCLAGRLPFETDDRARLLHAIQYEGPAPLPQHGPVPAELEAVCRRCLDRDSTRRPTARELAEWLERFAASPLPTVVENGVHRRPAETTTTPRRWRWRLLALAGLAVVLLGAGLTAWRSWPGQEPLPPDFPPSTTVAGKQRMVPALVRTFRIHHALDRGDAIPPEPQGEIGKDSHAARFADLVRIEVEVAEPAYLFLLAFHPNGKEQLLWPFDQATGEGDEWARGQSRQRLVFPPTGEDWLKLSDEPAGGTQAFAVVASRWPLPPFAQWKAQRGKAAWERRPMAGGVWGANPAGLFQVRNGVHEPAASEGASLDRLVRSLHAGADVAWVEVRAFGVQKKEGP